jgi:hypothetical protein
MGTIVGVPKAGMLWTPDPCLLATQAIPIAPGDDLVVSTWAIFSAQTLTINYRYLTSGGQIQNGTFTLVVGSGATGLVTRFSLPPGWLLDICVTTNTAATRRGDVFIQVALEPVTNLTDLLAKHTILIQDYVETGRHLAWPGSPIRSSLEGPFVQRSTLTSDPAAGVEITVTMGAGSRINLKAVTYTLVTSAAVATRCSHLIIDDGTNVLLDLPSSTTQTASLTYVYYWAAYAYAVGLIGTKVYNPLPTGLILPTLWRLRTSTDLIDSGDNYSAARYWAEFYIEV